jgi:hypothetical protein
MGGPTDPEQNVRAIGSSALAGLTGFSARFVLDAKGAATELQIVQPEGVFSAKRR